MPSFRLVLLAAGLWSGRAGAQAPQRHEMYLGKAVPAAACAPRFNATGLAAYRALEPTARRPGGLCAPSFLVIGAQKAATSTLSHLIRSHPRVACPKLKELFYFSGLSRQVVRGNASVCPDPRRDPRSLFRYLDNFPEVRAQPPARQVVTGEFSAAYLVCACCPAAARAVLPHAALVVMLRDPIRRASSRFREQRTFFDRTAEGVREPGQPDCADRFAQDPPRFCSNEVAAPDFESFVGANLPGLEQCLAKAATRLEARVRCGEASPLLGFSLYGDALHHWYGSFGRWRLRVFYAENLKDDPERVVRQVDKWLGLDPAPRSPAALHQAYNARGGYGWDRSSGTTARVSAAAVPTAAARAAEVGLAEATYRRLAAFYRPTVLQLEELAKRNDIPELPAQWRAEWGLGEG